MEYSEFLGSCKKINNKRNHSIKNSYGVYDGYKYYRKNRPKSSEYVLSESQYFSIIRTINKLLLNELLCGNDISFPCRMGRLEVRKYSPTLSFVNNKLVTNLPVDWRRTLKLWYEDKDSFDKKTVVRVEEKEIYKIYYSKFSANYPNKIFYQFKPNRTLKLMLKSSIKEGSFDAFKIK